MSFSLLKTCDEPNGITSNGNGKLPKLFDNLLLSTIHIFCLELMATVFSRKCAAPPPLIPWKSELISSAPSIVKSMWSTSSIFLIVIPKLRACSSVLFEVATPTIFKFSSLVRFPNASTKYLAVLPVPNPTIVLFCTNSAAL